MNYKEENNKLSFNIKEKENEIKEIEATVEDNENILEEK